MVTFQWFDTSPANNSKMYGDAQGGSSWMEYGAGDSHSFHAAGLLARSSSFSGSGGGVAHLGNPLDTASSMVQHHSSRMVGHYGGSNKVTNLSYKHQRNTNTLNKIIVDLTSKFADVRKKAATDLKVLVESQIRDDSLSMSAGAGMNGESSGFLDDLTQRLYMLVLSTDGNSKLGGISAIEELIDAKTDATETLCIRFANTFRLLFQQLATASPATSMTSSHSSSSLNMLNYFSKLNLNFSTVNNDLYSEGMMLQMIIESAATALGRLAASGGVLTVDIVDFHARQSLEWLSAEGSERSDRRLLIAVCVLRELAINTPTLFNVYMPTFLDVMWIALRDVKAEVRLGAVSALHVCLIDISKRNQRWKNNCYARLFQECTAGLRVDINNGSGSIKSSAQAAATAAASSTLPVHVVHGSLLVLGELLSNTGDYMDDKFDDVAELLLIHKHHTNSLIVRTVISLIPRLAAVNSREFTRIHLNTCLQYIIQSMQSSATRDVAFTAIGELALAVHDSILPVLDTILPQILKGLAVARSLRSTIGIGARRDATQSKINRIRASNTALLCIGMLSKALGDKLLPYAEQLIEAMFSVGLTAALVDSLIDVTNNIPQLLTPIQERLLQCIAAVLIQHLPAQATQTQAIIHHAGKSSNTPKQQSLQAARKTLQPSVAVPTPTLRSTPLAIAAVGSNIRSTPADGDESAAVKRHKQQEVEHSLLVLALKTLGTFNFDSQYMLLVELLNTTVVKYLEYDLPIVRREAALTCCKLLPQIVEHITYHGVSHSSVTVYDVTKSLVSVAISDPVASIRLSVLSSLDPRLDKYLAQNEILTSLFIALNDEVFAIREMCITLLGRLSLRNPATVLPVLRQTLIHMLGQLEEFDNDSVDLEESAKLLGHLIVSCQQLVRPYVTSVLSILLPKLTQYPMGGGTGGVASFVLSTIGKLALICSEEMIVHADQLLALIITSLSDKATHIKRQVAVRVLGEVLESVGYALDQPAPLKYPTLVPTLLTLLQTERNSQLRVEVLKVIGIIGALDPLQYRGVVSTDHQHQAVEKREGVCGAVYVYSETEVNGTSAFDPLNVNTTDTDYYPTVALHALMKCLDGGLGGVQLSNNLGVHGLILKSMMFIIRSLSSRCVPFLPTLIPLFLTQIQRSDDQMRLMFFAQLAAITNLVKQHVRPYLEQMLDACLQHWHHTSLLPGILTLVEELSLVLRDEFKGHLQRIIPRMVAVLNNDMTVDYAPTIRVLRSIRILATKGTLDDYLHVLVPCLVNFVLDDINEDNNVSVNIDYDAQHQAQRDGIHTLGRLAKHHDIADHASRIIQCFVRILQADNRMLQDEVLAVLAILIQQLGYRYLIFEPVIRKALESHLDHPHAWPYDSHHYHRYNRLLQKLTSGSTLPLNQYTWKADLHHHRIGNAGTGEMLLTDAVAPSADGQTSLSVATFSNSALRQSVPFAFSDLELTRTSSSESDEGDQIDSSGAAAAADAAMDHQTAPRKLAVSQSQLMRAWSSQQRSTRDDWLVWLRQFSIQLLRESPSPALRACSALAQKYPPLAKELFNAAFLSCWVELFDQYQDDLVRSLELTFQSKNIPVEVVTSLLDLAEYMEVHDKALPIDISTLAQLAERCQAYPKALHYRENELALNPTSTSTLEALISLNIKLQQHDAAHGILKLASNLHTQEQYKDLAIQSPYAYTSKPSDDVDEAEAENEVFQLKESWYEKLERWEDALEAYERRQLDEPDNVEVLLGRMRCLKALNEWERLSQLSSDLFDRTTDTDVKHAVAPLAASAAFALRIWDRIDDYVDVMDDRTVDSSFYGAISCIHKNMYNSAYKLIDRACESVDTGLTALMSESYHRAYPAIVKVQQFIELQEVIGYKLGTEEKRDMIRQTWENRLSMCERNVDVWQEILSIRSLVVTATQDIDTWIEFGALCRKTNKLHLSLKIITSLLGFSPSLYVTQPQLRLPKTYPQLTLACLKHLYTAGYQREAYIRLHELVNNSTALQYSADRADRLSSDELAHLRAVAFLKLGSWQLWMLDTAWDRHHHANTDEARNERAKQYAMILPNVISCFQASCSSNHTFYKAWHEFAMVNFRVVQQYKHISPQTQISSSDKDGDRQQRVHMPNVENHVIPAIQGFFRSIWLQAASQISPTSAHNRLAFDTYIHNTMQDVLRVLALWFDWGMRKDVDAAVLQGINTISIDSWLEVIPQLIARIYTPHKMIRLLLIDLLCRIGKQHPQAIVWALTVASKSPSEGRRRSAVAVLHEMRKYSALHSTLVQQALLVSQELVRVAILWHELWHEAIEEASRHWFGAKNFDLMISTLQPLHVMLESKAQTAREQLFYEQYGAELRDALSYCMKYKTTRDGKYIEQAWQIYSGVFRKLSKSVSGLHELELSDVSPKLLQSNDLQLAIPGSYRANTTSVKISYFAPLLHVIESKQHPRRILIGGSDGNEYAFLLKGHEDLRQDERCMQFFGLVNSLLDAESTRFRDISSADLSIERYSVIPLSVWPQSGLLAWVPHVDPLHAAIKQYRDARRILLNIEQRLMMRFAPDYQTCTVIQKVEVFQHALQMTTGQDLAKVLWLRSPSADTWLERRVIFTRSLATMSMVGYVLGLGDRHTCNLLLDKQSGKIIHIDFGDCFEVAMHREKYPEKVPFRLTRMLVQAMEVAGIDGTFRTTCEVVMRVMRKNKNSLMAVLEAFVHDPLINWRLLADQKSNTNPQTTASTAQKKQEDVTGNTIGNAEQQRDGVKRAVTMTGQELKTPIQPSQPFDADGNLRAKLYDTVSDDADPDMPMKTGAEPNDPASPKSADGDQHSMMNNNVVGAELGSKMLELQRQRSVGTMLNNAANASVDLEIPIQTETLNEKALAVIARVESKLKGTDFIQQTNGTQASGSSKAGKRARLSPDARALDVSQQVDRLIQEATSHVNLCQAYIGWCPWW